MAVAVGRKGTLGKDVLRRKNEATGPPRERRSRSLGKGQLGNQTDAAASLAGGKPTAAAGVKDAEPKRGSP